MTSEEKIDYWVDLSDYDLESAEVMLFGKRYLYVGFLCHQAIEKILKGCYTKGVLPYWNRQKFCNNG